MSEVLEDVNPFARDPDDEALDWLLRIQNEGLDDAGQRAFRAWRESSSARADAYARAEAVWTAPEFLAALKQPHSAPRRRSGQARLLRIAASIALVAVMGIGTLRIAGVTPHMPADYATGIGEQHIARLDDGTRIVLDSGASVDLDYTGGKRRIVLKAGRAFFDVGRDARPFRVEAQGVLIRDVGTRFSVERGGHGVQVAVQAGEVALRPAESGVREQHLTAGQTGGYAQGFLAARTVPADITFAWLDHRLFFSQARLGGVVEELRRYHRGWIIVANPRLADIKVSGGYDTRDPASAMEDLARLSGGTLLRLSDHLLILR